MCIDRLAIGVMALVLGGGLDVGSPSASAQGYGGPGSLGGFGGSSAGAMAGMGGASTMIVPYGGSFEGFMPGRMGTGSSPSFRARPGATMGARRGTFGLSPPSGGMSGMSGGILGGRSTSPIGSRGGMGIGGGMRRAPDARGAGVMPPSIGYPFRQPPSLVSPSSGAGMSM